MLVLLLAAAAAASCANPQTQGEMTRCAGQAYQAADAEMTRQWKVRYAAMKRRDAQDTSRGGGFGYAAALLESQRAWLRFRDTQCVIEGAEFSGGSARPMAQAQCRARLTRQRTAQLKSLDWQK